MALPDILKHRLRLPVVGAPLFIISHPALVIAQCKAGIVGAFPALNARPISQLDEWLHEITEALAAHDRAHPERPAAPFAVNQIVHKSNARLEEDMALTVKWKAPIVITSLGAREDVNQAVHGYGGDHAARHHQRPLRPQGGREGRRRPDRGRGRRRRPCRVGLAVRADPGHPRLVRRAAPAVGRDRDRAGPSSPRRRWARISPISARLSSPPPRRARSKPTSRRSSTATPPTSSAPPTSPASSAIISRPRSSNPASTPTPCPSATRRR